MSGNWDLYVLEYAVSHEPWVALVNGTHDEGMVDLPFSFVLATNEDKKILIDTGFMQTGCRSEFPLKFEVTKWISPLRVLAELDVAPDDVTDIVITHAHFDHMGSIAEFPRAHIHIQKSELLSWYEAITLPKRFNYLTKIIDPENLRAALEASIEKRVFLIDGDKDDLLPGIHVRLGSGHTIGQQFVLVETAAGRRVISGDCVYSGSQIAGRGGDGIYVPLNNAVGSVWEQLKTIDRMNDEIGGDISKLVILHDVERWKNSPVVRELEGFRIVQIA